MKWFEHTINLAKRTKLIFNQGSLKKNTGNHVLLFHWKWSSQWGSIEGWSLRRESFHCNRSAWVMHGFHSIGRYSNRFNKLLIRMRWVRWSFHFHLRWVAQISRSWQNGNHHRRFSLESNFNYSDAGWRASRLKNHAVIRSREVIIFRGVLCPEHELFCL